MYGGKKQNCPIDDEGLRFIIAIESEYEASTTKKRRLHPFPSSARRTANCEFFLVDRRWRQGNIRSYASKISYA